MSAVPARPDATPASPPGPVAQVGAWDWPLLTVAVLLAGFGLLMITSASSLFADSVYGDALHFVGRQGAALVVGLSGAAVIVLMPWRRLRWLAWPAYCIAIVGLLLVHTPLGHTANNATRWISLGGIHFQPSEFAKLALVLVLADYLARNEGRLRDVVGVALPAVALLPAPILVLVMLEPDFGTTVILVGLVGVLLFVAGLQWRWLAVLGATAITSLAVMAVVTPYRMRRLVSFLDPFSDPDGAGYQVVQGWIALASGGLLGQGIATGVAQRGFLPEAHTDFIAAVVAEELGGVGLAVVVLAYGVILWRGTVIASRATDLFGMLAASAVTALLGAQAVINLGVVVGLMPAKGLVLPFLSYGASAAVVHVMCIGLLLRVSMENRAFDQALRPEES